MSISLTPIRYYTANDPKHYIVDNRPIEDVAANIEILKDELESMQTNFVNYTAQGAWGSMVITLPLNVERNKAFGYKLKVWALQDKDGVTDQDSTLLEVNLLGSNDVGGNVVIHNYQTTVNLQFGDPVEINLTEGLDLIQITFTGYVGSNGFAQVKAERFGF
jgi:hypothetical protein